MKGIYLSTLVVKNCVGKNEFIYHTLGPMLGTLTEDGIFINNYDRLFYSMDNIKLAKSNIRYGFYNLIELDKFKSQYKRNFSLETLIKKYNTQYKDISYYVYFKDETDFFIIAFNKDKLKKVPTEEDSIATKL